MERETAIVEMVHRECGRLGLSPALVEQAEAVAMAAYREGCSAFRAIRRGVESVAVSGQGRPALRLVVDNVSHAAA